MSFLRYGLSETQEPLSPQIKEKINEHEPPEQPIRELTKLQGEDDELLFTIYTELMEEDTKIKQRAIEAYYEGLKMGDEEDEIPVMEEGMVPRRGILFTQTSGVGVVDPAMKKNPLRGKLICLLGTTAALLFVYLQS